MEKYNESILQLEMRLEILSKRQEQFSREINDLRLQIEKLKASKQETTIPVQEPKKEAPVSSEPVISEPKKIIEEVHFQQETSITPSKPAIFDKEEAVKPEKRNLEKFIGENLLNKIGIIITIIGVAIGVKYSIEHELITPLTRIILGYISGIGLLGFGIKLKKKYENYSAVLVSGAIAIMYFITYAAHSFYGFIPQTVAFGMMVIFTVLGVITAIHYNRQVIAHIGLVGAYAIPFLLSTNSGNVAVLFTYMAIINIGILTISFKKYWKSLFASAFGLTWLIYASWFATKYIMSIHFGLALSFVCVFFVIFYITFLAYKLIKKEAYSDVDIIFLLANTFIFYGLGYLLLKEHKVGENFLGLFTLLNAVVHLIVSYIFYTKKESDRNLLYLTFGLVLTFITIAVPVQFDGNWVILLWSMEAAILFWIGRTKNEAIFEKLAYPVMILAFFSILYGWATLYPRSYSNSLGTEITPIFNMNFLSSVVFILAFGFINYLYHQKEYTSPLKLSKKLWKLLSFIVPGIFIFVLYYAFRMEIANYWNQLYLDMNRLASEENSYLYYTKKSDLLKFKTIWILNYTLIFLAALSYVNIKKLRNARLGYITLGLNVFMIFIFLTQGLFALSELRNSYIHKTNEVGFFNIGIRYVSYVFIILILFVTYHFIREKFIKKDFKMIYDGVVHVAALSILSSELIHWLDIASTAEADKLGLSILWGIYALFVIVLGIWKKKKYLRIGAIALFGITLVKLFMYDISHITTIAKTIVFVSLGVLLLIISFLYNKYKDKIFD